MKTRFTRGLVAAATVVALSTTAVPAVSAAEATPGEQVAASTALAGGSAAVVGSSVGFGLLYGAVRAVIWTAIYNHLVTTGVIKPAQLPEWLH